MKLNYKGNLVFTPDGSGVFSGVGRRVTFFDLTQNDQKATTLPFELKGSVQHIALSPDGLLMLATDGMGHGVLCNVARRVVLHHFSWKEAVRLASFSPDGRWVATTDAGDVKIHIWKAPQADTYAFHPLILEKTFTGHSAEILSLEWSSDGRYLVTASEDMTSRIYDLQKDELNPKYRVLELRAHRHPLVGAFFGDDDQRVHTVGRNGSVFTWRFHKGKGILLEMEPYKRNHTKTAVLSPKDEELAKKNQPPEEEKQINEDLMIKSKVTAVSFCQQRNLLVTAFANGVFSIHRVGPLFETIYSLGLTQSQTSSIAINSNGNWIALGARDRGQLVVWDWTSESFIFKQRASPGPMPCVAYSPDGQSLATGSIDGKVKLWNAMSGICISTFSDHQAAVSAVEFARQGKILVSASNDGTVRAYDLIRFRNFRTFTTPSPVQFLSLTVDPSGEVVAAGTLDTFEIYIWNMQTGQLLDVISGHQGPISALAFDPSSGTLLASASWDKSVRLWEIFKRDMNPQELVHSSEVLGLAFRPDGQELAAITLKGQIVSWAVDLAEITNIYDCRRDFAEKPLSTATLKSICYSPDGTFMMAVGSFPFVALYNVRTRVLVKRYFLRKVRQGVPHSQRKEEYDYETTSVRMSPTGRSFAALTEEGLMIFSLDEYLIFDPFDLEVDLTPERIRAVLREEGDFLKAWVLAHRLNSHEMILEAWQSIPMEIVYSIAQGLPQKYLQSTLSFLADLLVDRSHQQQLEQILGWVSAILREHILAIRNEQTKYGAVMRLLETRLKSRYSEFRKEADRVRQSIAVWEFWNQQSEPQPSS